MFVNIDEVSDKVELTKTRTDIVQKVKFAMTTVKNYSIKEFSDKDYIWKDDKQRYLKEIKTYGRPLEKHERDDPTSPTIPKTIKDDYPPLPLYKIQVSN